LIEGGGRNISDQNPEKHQAIFETGSTKGIEKGDKTGPSGVPTSHDGHAV